MSGSYLVLKVDQNPPNLRCRDLAVAQSIIPAGERKRRKQKASEGHKGGEGKALRVDINANGSAAEQQATAAESGDLKHHPIFSKVLAKAKTLVSRIR